MRRILILGTLLFMGSVQAGLSEDNLNLCLKNTYELQEAINFTKTCSTVSEIGARIQIARANERCYQVYRNSNKIHRERNETFRTKQT